LRLGIEIPFSSFITVVLFVVNSFADSKAGKLMLVSSGLVSNWILPSTLSSFGASKVERYVG
jgi:hypothetical protein